MFSYKNLKYLITGTGRCGTVYMSRFFTSIGFPCGHESIFNEKNLFESILKGKQEPKTSECSTYDFLNKKPINVWLNDEIVAESSYLAVPYLNHTLLKDVNLIHVVRNPLDVISSFVKDFNYFSDESPGDDPWENIIYKFLPQLRLIPSQIERAAWYYYAWNRIIENSNPQFFHRIEDSIEPFFDFLNIKPCDYFKEKVNSFKKRDSNYRWHDLPDGTIRWCLLEMSERYGYYTKRRLF